MPAADVLLVAFNFLLCVVDYWPKDHTHGSCRTALTKKHRKRPSASALLEHPWVVKNMARAVGNGCSAELEKLLEPIPLSFADTAPLTRPCQQATAEAPGILPSAAAQLTELNHSETVDSTSRALNNIRMVDGKGNIQFSVPAEDFAGVDVQLLSTEEKSDTMQARGMKARLQLYINRQRIEDTGEKPIRACSSL